MNKILRDDFQSVYDALGKKLLPLKGRSVLVSGANGMLAGYMVKFLSWLSTTHGYELKISGIVRQMKQEVPGVNYITGDVCHVTLHGQYDFIIHAASLASPVHYGSDPIGVSLPNILGTVNLLKHAESFPVKSFLFISSSEIYGDFGTDKTSIEESETGKLDPMNPRSCYAESKRMGESLCVSWFRQKHVPVKIVRPFHTFGPGVSRSDGRVYADFIYSVVDKKAITLNSKGDAKRAFCYQSDALTGMLLILLEGTDGEAYNLGNPGQELSIREAAEAAAGVFPERNIKVSFNDQTSQGYLKSAVLRNAPSIKKLSLMGWNPSVTFAEGIRRSVEYIEGEK